MEKKTSTKIIKLYDPYGQGFFYEGDWLYQSNYKIFIFSVNMIFLDFIYSK